MAKRPRTIYSTFTTLGATQGYEARVTGYGAFRNYGGGNMLNQSYHGKEEHVGRLVGVPKDYAHFKLMFDAWWTAISPWETYAYDIVIYDRLGRSLGTATEFGPLIARTKCKELMERVNGASAVIMRRNRKTLEVKQEWKHRRRVKRAA